MALEDARWHEVILLAAGQLGIVEARRDDASDFVQDLLKVEPRDPGKAGRQVVLTGRPPYRRSRQGYLLLCGWTCSTISPRPLSVGRAPPRRGLEQVGTRQGAQRGPSSFFLLRALRASVVSRVYTWSLL